MNMYREDMAKDWPEGRGYLLAMKTSLRVDEKNVRKTEFSKDKKSCH